MHIVDQADKKDLIDLAHAPRAALHTFSLSFAAPRHGGGLISEDMPRLPSGADLRALELTLSRVSATHGGVPLPLDAFHALAAQTDFARITRLALLNLLLDAGMLATVLAASPALEELYISITGPEALDALAGDTPPDLRIVHANAPEQPHLVPPREVLAVAAANIPNCEQIGSMNRVYEVFRRYEGESVVVELHRWSRVDTPGYFRVWRP